MRGFTTNWGGCRPWNRYEWAGTAPTPPLRRRRHCLRLVRNRNRGWLDPFAQRSQVQRDIAVDHLISDLQVLVGHPERHEDSDDVDHDECGNAVVDENHHERQALAPQLVRVAVEEAC